MIFQNDSEKFVYRTGVPRWPLAQVQEGTSDESQQKAANELPFSVAEAVCENPYSLGLFVLRQNGMERLYRFMTEYEDGWGDGSGRSLHPEALRALYVFMRYAPINLGSSPSIFMTPEGGLEFAWDDPQGHDIRVEFRPNEVQYYFSRTGAEGCSPLEGVKEFAENFQSLE